MVAPLKLSPMERIDLIDEVIGLAAHALRLRHPRPEALVVLSFRALLDVSNADLAALHLELKAWIADREEEESGDAAGS